VMDSDKSSRSSKVTYGTQSSARAVVVLVLAAGSNSAQLSWSPRGKEPEGLEGPPPT
jgi:hypothetical protein